METTASGDGPRRWGRLKSPLNLQIASSEQLSVLGNDPTGGTLSVTERLT